MCNNGNPAPALAVGEQLAAQDGTAQTEPTLGHQTDPAPNDIPIPTPDLPADIPHAIYLPGPATVQNGMRRMRQIAAGNREWQDGLQLNQVDTSGFLDHEWGLGIDSVGRVFLLRGGAGDTIWDDVVARQAQGARVIAHSHPFFGLRFLNNGPPFVELNQHALFATNTRLFGSDPNVAFEDMQPPNARVADLNAGWIHTLVFPSNGDVAFCEGYPGSLYQSVHWVFTPYLWEDHSSTEIACPSNGFPDALLIQDFGLDRLTFRIQVTEQNAWSMAACRSNLANNTETVITTYPP